MSAPSRGRVAQALTTTTTSADGVWVSQVVGAMKVCN
jgi:hypothetical protein